MNKEEIEHIEEIKKMLNFTTNDKETGLQMNGEVCHLLLEYINCLEQKESILDKVTDKLKEDIENDYCIKEYKSNEYGITGAKEYPVKPYAREILNVIEGEKE